MRINLFGGPGCGKSTLASKLFADLKAKQHSIELVHEYIKKWAYAKRVPKSFDQVYIFGQQLHAEDLIFQSGVRHLITDSPICMQPYYSKAYNFSMWGELMMIAKRYEAVHPSLNIFLDRTGVIYHQQGRYEDYDKALERDREMRAFLEEQAIPFVTMKTTDYESILEYVENALSQKTEKPRPKRKRKKVEFNPKDYEECMGT